MKMGLIWTALVAIGVAASGCHQEPPMVVKFQPAASRSADAGLAHTAPSAAQNAQLAPEASPAPRATAGGAAAAPSAPPAAKRPAPPSGRHHRARAAAACHAAADCTLVPLDCCDCANGGKLKAIPKSQTAADKTERDRRCKGVMCTMMFSTDPTCGMRASCVAGSCVLEHH